MDVGITIWVIQSWDVPTRGFYAPRSPLTWHVIISIGGHEPNFLHLLLLYLSIEVSCLFFCKLEFICCLLGRMKEKRINLNFWIVSFLWAMVLVVKWIRRISIFQTEYSRCESEHAPPLKKLCFFVSLFLRRG